MNDKDKKNDKIKFSENKDGKKITYEVEKKDGIYKDTEGKNPKEFKNVSGNNWFFASAEWKGAEDKEWKKKYEPKVGVWITGVVVILLLVGGIVALVRSRSKKKSLNEEKFL